MHNLRLSKIGMKTTTNRKLCGYLIRIRQRAIRSLPFETTVAALAVGQKCEAEIQVEGAFRAEVEHSFNSLSHSLCATLAITLRVERATFLPARSSGLHSADRAAFRSKEVSCNLAG